MRGIEAIQARLREASALPELLAAGFDAFEVIRTLARRSEDTSPGLFAGFMMAADAAVDGREAITIAPSLSPERSSTPYLGPSAAGAEIKSITNALAALAALLSECLADAAKRTPTPGDRTACEEAADAGHRIHQLLARDDDRHLR